MASSAAGLAADVPRALQELSTLAVGSAERAEISDRLDQCLSEMKLIIYGGDRQAGPDPVEVEQLREALLQPSGAFLCMVTHHTHAAFEARKLIASIVSHMLRKYSPTVKYVQDHPEMLVTLARGYTNPDIALTCGSMLRESLCHDDLHMVVADSAEIMGLLVQTVQRPNFDIATDAFSTFKDLMTLHKTRRCAAWMEAKYEEIFRAFSQLHRCENYVTRRLSLKLLGEVRNLTLCTGKYRAHLFRLSSPGSLSTACIRTVTGIARPNQLQRHDAVHRRRCESEADYASTGRHVQGNSLRGIPR